MEVLQGVGGGAVLLVSAILGIRLVFLARRDRSLPELLLGMSFLCGGALGAVLEANAAVFGHTHGNSGTLLAIGKFFGLVGMLFNSVFVWWVFRRRAAWALGLVGLIALVLFGAYLGHAASGAFSTGVVQHLWFWIELLGRLMSPIWLGIEAFVYYRAMRRRVALALAEPIAANRFLLWTIASMTGIVVLLSSVPPLYVIDDALLAIDLVIFALAGVATGAIYWLAFFPTAGYCRFVERRAAEELGAAEASAA